MKIKKSNRKKGLMNKFLVPFAVFLGIVVICMYIIYRPQYKRLFLNNINVKMKPQRKKFLNGHLLSILK